MNKICLLVTTAILSQSISACVSNSDMYQQTGSQAAAVSGDGATAHVEIGRFESQDNLIDRGWENNRPGSYRAAIILFTEAMKRGPDNPDAYGGRAYSYKKLGDWERNISDLHQQLRINPKDKVGLNTMGWQYATHLDPAYRDGEMAVIYARQAVAQRPHASHVVSTLAAAYAEAGNFEKAIVEQQRAIDLELKERGQSSYLFELQRDLGFFRRGEPVRDHQMLKELQIGRNAAISGDYPLALAELRKAITIMPDNRIVHGEMGRALMGMGKYDEAVASFRRDLELDELDQESHWSLAWILASHPDAAKRDGAEALRLAREAVRLQDRATSYDALAAAQAELGDFEAAVKSQRTAIAEGKREGLPGKQREKRLQQYLSGKPWRLSAM